MLQELLLNASRIQIVGYCYLSQHSQIAVLNEILNFVTLGFIKIENVYLCVLKVPATVSNSTAKEIANEIVLDACQGPGTLDTGTLVC